VHVLCDLVTEFVDVDTENRAAERPHGESAAPSVEVDVTYLAPVIGGCLRRLRHVSAEAVDILFGEHRL
jgi:hypothetical protein